MELWSNAIEESRITNRNLILMLMIELLHARAGLRSDLQNSLTWDDGPDANHSPLSRVFR